MTEENIVSVIERLVERVNDLEVKLDNLRVQFDHHDHPWKPEPRIG